MKILIVNYYMKPGGIATALTSLLDAISKNKDTVIDLLLLNDDVDERYDIPESVNLLKVSKPLKIYSKSLREILRFGDFHEKILALLLHGCSKIAGEHNFVKFLISFESEKKNYDVAISFTNDIIKNKMFSLKRKYSGGCNDYVLMKSSASKKIAWIHNEPNELGMTYSYSKNMYKDFDNIVHVSNETKKKFDKIIPEFSQKSVVVNNMIDEQRISRLSNEFNPYKEDRNLKIVTVARIDNNQKRIDRIIESCRRLNEDNITNFSWSIIGDGPDLEFLIKEAHSKGVGNVLNFLGSKSNPYPYIKNADILVMSSHHEAYSMVLLEAVALKTPILCTDYASAHEIVKDGVNGILVDNSTEGVYCGLKRIIEDPAIVSNLKNKMKNLKSNNEIVLDQFYSVIEI